MAERQSPLGGMRILVVDDDDDTRELVARVPETRGAEVVGAASADEAWAAFEQSVPDAMVESLRAGFQSHMAKPVDPEVLVEVMARLTGRD